MSGLPLSLYLKSRLVGSPLERAAKKLQALSQLRVRAKHPELGDIFLEGDRAEMILQRLLKPDSCCVDVGCHIGSFLSLILQNAPNGRHVAIEASSDKSAWLKQNFPMVDIRTIAVGAAEGEASFFEDSERPGFSRLGVPASKSSVERKLKIQTLDHILKDIPRIDFIKLDIEGGELNALKGSRETIARHRPAMLFECGAENVLVDLSVDRKELFDLITIGLGYNIFSFPDFLHDKGRLSFDEFRKCGIYPFRAFNFVATTDHP